MRWTSGSTLAAALAATIFYPWIVTHYLFEAIWQPVVLTACVSLLAGGFWRQALKLVIGGGAALLVHAQLAAGAGPDVPIWQPVVLAALAGLVTLCLWRLLAVAGAVVASLMVLRLAHDGVPPELILEAIRIRLE
ncbi:hypothetical protein [Jannaschia seosinensis]|nr:hypothetical protein [Jannaschia seosinensis]